MAIIARQFGRPHGPLGRLTGTVMAHTNAAFSRWVMQQIAEHPPGSTGRIAELGPGPGIGLEAALRLFPQARVWGIDPSPVMLSQSRKRNPGRGAGRAADANPGQRRLTGRDRAGRRGGRQPRAVLLAPAR
jgi:SAM-dependent methyltransferase